MVLTVIVLKVIVLTVMGVKVAAAAPNSRVEAGVTFAVTSDL